MNTRARSLAGLAAIAVVVGVVLIGGRDMPSSSASAPAVVDSTPTTAPPNDTASDTTSVAAPPDTTQPSAPETTDPATPELPDRGVHPELRDIDGWLQSDVTSLEELRGQVVAVQFWTFGCSNCRATLPHMQQLYADYHEQGFEIVGIHAPEFEHEADVDNIVAAAADLGVAWPIALDTEKRTFHFWQEGTRAFWPRIYLLDRDGHIRYDHIGEGRYDEIDAAVRALLAETK